LGAGIALYGSLSSSRLGICDGLGCSSAASVQSANVIKQSAEPMLLYVCVLQFAIVRLYDDSSDIRIAIATHGHSLAGPDDRDGYDDERDSERRHSMDPQVNSSWDSEL
jgi:hypothetical protein